VKKLTGGFDNGLGAVLIGEHSLASFLSEKIAKRHFGTFSTVSVKARNRCAIARCAGDLTASAVTSGESLSH
jgi:hypothetical protein